MKPKDLLAYDYIIMRNPYDQSEGGDIQDNSTRIKYMMTARRMRQPPEPTPLNKTAMTSHVGIMFGGIPFFPHQTGRVMDNYFYDGLLTIDDQPQDTAPSAFAVSGSPKSKTNY